MLESSGHEIKIFRSVHHPGDRPAGWVYTEAFLTPLAACTLPIMIATVIAALQMMPLEPFLVIGFPLAFLTAAVWTHFRLRMVRAELFIHEGLIAFRTVHDCLSSSFSVPWYPVLEVRVDKDAIAVITSDATHVLKREAWPRNEELLEALIGARDKSSAIPYPGL